MQKAPGQPLSRARLPQDQHRQAGPGYLCQLRLHPTQRRAVADKISPPGRQRFAQPLDARIGHYTLWLHKNGGKSAVFCHIVTCGASGKWGSMVLTKTPETHIQEDTTSEV